jgi:hypothetical protein
MWNFRGQIAACGSSVWRALLAGCSQAAKAVDDSEEGDRSARQKAHSQADDKGPVVLIEAVYDADDLQDAKAAEGDERDAFIGLFAPEGDGLRDEERCIAEQGKTEDKGDDFSHGMNPASFLFESSHL